MSILDTLEDVNETDLHIRAIRMAEFTNSPTYWMDAYEACARRGDEIDLATYCFNMVRGLRRFNELEAACSN